MNFMAFIKSARWQVGARRSRMVPALLVLAVALGGLVRSGEPQASTDPAIRGSVSGAVADSDAERGARRDELVLWNGSRRVGHLLDATIGLRASYGRLQLPLDGLAEIRFGGPEGTPDIVQGRAGERFSGFVENADFRIRLESGEETAIRHEQVQRLVLRSDRTRLPPAVQEGRWVSLRNGDAWEAGSVVDFSMISSAGDGISQPWSGTVVVRFLDSHSRRVMVERRDGSVVTGVLNDEDLEWTLGIGPTIRIHSSHLAMVFERSARPGMAAGSKATERLIQPGDDLTARGLVWLAAGSSLVGSLNGERDRGMDEGPQVEVAFGKGFWIGRCEVSQRDYLEVMGVNPSYYVGDLDHPVEKISWHEAMEYCAKRTATERAGGVLPEGFEYRLPTEAEWEYACRAGTSTRFSYGDDPEYLRLGRYAWFNGNSDSTTHPVGLKEPNPWGLYDMHGNVWEWCLDHGARTGEESGGRSSSLRGARGGSWLYEGRFCRSANRDSYFPGNRCSDLGFRVILAPVGD
jgi:formylglycine-generating enzyme required for sulfatase activity